MKTRVFKLLLLTPIALLGIWGFSYEEPRLEVSNPLYINDISLFDGKLLTAERGTNSVSLYSRDGQVRLKSWSVEEQPTGVVSDGTTIYATTSFAKGGVEIIKPEEDAPT
ncbi:MAG: hypothetical protein J6U52_02930, partial [Alistipes sp.]|nr:hypothetical protein [Alistipes sp.]